MAFLTIKDTEIIMKIRVQLVPILSSLLLVAITFLSGCATPERERSATQTFFSACSAQASATFCQDFEKSTFKNSSSIQEFSTHEFMAVDFPTDKKTQFLKIYDTHHTAALGYCYFVSKGRIEQNSLNPSDFSRLVNGFAVMNSEVPDYEAWLETEAGVQCRQHVKDSAGLPLIDLKGQLTDKIGLVMLNPVSMAVPNADLKNTVEGIKHILNHERIHILHSACPAINDFALQSWATYDPLKIAALKKQFPKYNWENPEVATRELLAFTYETDPSPLFDIAKNCNF